MKLKELKNGFLKNDSFIPLDEKNSDYQEIKKYIAEGGEYEKFDWLNDAKLLKIAELNEYYSSDKCWSFKVFSQQINKKIYSITKNSDFFAKLLPACAGKSFFLYTDDGEVIEYKNLTDEKAKNVNYKINLEISFKLKQKKIELEKRINDLLIIEEIKKIDIKKEFSVINKEINLDNE
jgi:hypothetical protein